MLQRLTKGVSFQQMLIFVAKKSYPIRRHPKYFLKQILAKIFFRSNPSRDYDNFGIAISSLQKTEAKQKSAYTFMLGTLGPGGTERQATETLCALKRRGIDALSLFVFDLSSEINCFYLPKIEASNIFFDKVIRSNKQVTTPELKKILRVAEKYLPLEIIADTLAVIRSLAVTQPKLVHLWLDEVNIKGGFAAIALGIPKIILSTRSLPPQNFALYRPYMQSAYKWLLKQPSIIILNNSEAGARAYEDWLELPRGKIKVVRNGFNFDKNFLEYLRLNRLIYRKSKHIPQDKIVLGTVIRFSEEKRPELWLEIAALVQKKMPNVHFLMVGDGPLYNEIKAKRTQFNLDASLHMIGYEKEVLSAIAAMDLLLLTSRAEGLPNVLIEAQALGVPVVTTNVGGAPEAVDHGRTGWVLSSDDPESAANTIVELLSDKNWLKAASLAGPKFIQQHFGIDRMMNETLAVYHGENV